MNTLDLKLNLNVTFYDTGAVSVGGVRFGESTNVARFLKSRAFDQYRKEYVKFEDERRAGMNLQAKELVGMAKEVMAWTRNNFPRTFYIPKTALNLRQLPDGKDLDLEFWAYDGEGKSAGKVFGIAFWGKANKPLWHFIFRNQADFEKKVQETIETRKSHVDRVQQRRQERSQFQHTLKEGDILYSSWGYDQTNIDFYQVTAVGEKSVKIRPIASKLLDSDGRGSDKVVAVPNHFTGEPMTKIVRKGNVVSIASYANAYPWDGNPKHETSSGWGH